MNVFLWNDPQSLPPKTRSLCDAAAAESASEHVLAFSSSAPHTSAVVAEANEPHALRARERSYACLLASVLSPRAFRSPNLPLAVSGAFYTNVFHP
jgi:hypothetical protein